MAHSGTVIRMRNVPGKPKKRALTAGLPYKTMAGHIETIPAGFEWDGATVPWPLVCLFPRHNHPIATCRHDWRCKHARNSRDRKFADDEFRKDVATTSWWLTEQFGYLGVRIGANLGIGSNF
jgi:hypothetical protein